VRDFKKERGRSRRILRMLGGVGMLGALLLVAALCASAAWSMYGKFQEAAAADAASQAELANLNSQYDEASAKTDLLGTPEGQEAALRERYGVAAPGEGEIDIVRQQGADTSGPAAPQNLWEKLWHALFVW
jgi:hypothetical protein